MTGTLCSIFVQHVLRVRFICCWLPLTDLISIVFLYLNDVEEGGGTHFKGLDITVQPKTGRAVVWPSVLDQDPDRKDPRTHHEALPVIKGVKYGGRCRILPMTSYW